MAFSVYFLDASALIHRYAALVRVPESRMIRHRIDDLFTAASRQPERIVLQLPSVCLAESARAFARLCFEDRAFGVGEAAEDAFRRLHVALLNDVRRDRVIHSYELRRVHFEGIEDIFRKDYLMPAPRQGRRLGAHDALILSMAREYAHRHVRADVRVVTNDRRISDFCRTNVADFPAAVHISTQSPV